MIHQTHGHRERHVCSSEPGDKGDAATMKTMMRQIQGIEKESPVFRGTLGEVDCVARARLQKLLEERAQALRQRDAVGAAAPAFGRRKVESSTLQVDLGAEVNAGLPQAAARGHTYAEGAAHPNGLSEERGFNKALLGLVDLGFLSDGVVACSEGIEDVAINQASDFGLVEQGLEHFDLASGGVVGDVLASGPFVRRAPTEIRLSMLMAKGARMRELLLAEIERKVPPAQLVGLKRSWSARDGFQEGGDPIPSAGESVASGRGRLFGVGVFGEQGGGSAAVVGVVSAQAGADVPPLTGLEKREVVIGRARSSVERGHGESKTALAVQRCAANIDSDTPANN